MGTQGQSCTGLPTSASLRPPPRCAQILAFLTPPNPAVLSRAKTTPQASCWPGASSISRILCLSFRNTVPPILPPHCFPLLLGLYVHAPLLTALSLSLSTLCPPVWPSSLPTLRLSRSAPLLSTRPFLQGSLRLAHLSLPSSLRVSGAALGALAPAPVPSLLSFLLSFWKVQSPSGLAGWEGVWGVCCELLPLT